MIALFLLPALFILGLLAYGYRSRLHKALKNNLDLVALASNLYGQLLQSEKRADDLKEVAKQAIDEAGKAARLTHEELWRSDPLSVPLPRRSSQECRAEFKYIAPEVRFCSCNVSIRSETWPVACPACGKMVGDDSILDADLID